MNNFTVFIVALILCGALIYLAYRFRKRKKKYTLGLDKFIEKSKRYNATVLENGNVPIDAEKNLVEAVIIQFRDEEQRKTIVHRYTDSHGKKYSRGDKIVVYYCEESDAACIENDNPFARNVKKCHTIEILLYILSAVVFVVGLIYFCIN